MDFGSVLHVAQKNEKLPKKEIKYYSTKFDPPKKEERSKQLSSNIKKFLARKEAEEKKRTGEANAKREELLALRSQDKKATRRVSVMLKRTKSANKSVIQDAVDNDNTAVTLAGPSQPDEDDYGYVSQEASAYYNKMMQKYNNAPEDSKFAKSKRSVSVNLNGTKDRVRAALLKEQEDALLPHKRKRRTRDDDTSNETYNEDEYRHHHQERERERDDKPSAKPRPKVAAPPPINFSELLKLAEKKQFEPIKIEPKKEVKEEERPMTKKQKREVEKERAWREKKEKGLTNGSSKDSGPSAPRPNGDRSMPPPNKIPKINNGAPSNGKIPKLPGTEERSRNGQRPPQFSQNIPRKNDDKYSSMKRDDRERFRDERERVRDDRDRLRNDDRERNLVRKSEADRPRIATSNGTPYSSSADRRPDPSKVSKLRQELEKNRAANKQPPPPPSRPPGGSQMASQNTNRAQLTKQPAARPTSALDKSKGLTRRDVSNVKDMKARPPMDRPKQFPPSDLKPKQFPPTDLKPKQFPPADLKPKQFPPADLKPKQFPPTDVRRKQFPPKDVKRKPPMGHKRRIIHDDDSEYDSEMDDFIDDGAGEGEDYSKYISEIFGYDKSRYRSVDDMDDNMESSFSQMMKEEYMSSKIGLMEDLEDMKQEAEEKKRKQDRMKKLKK